MAKLGQKWNGVACMVGSGSFLGSGSFDSHQVQSVARGWPCITLSLGTS